MNPFDATVFFFFSSRRRHTRFDCDWSSDVCSSDLSSTVVSPLYGKLSDIHGRRAMMLLAIGLFLAGSVLSAAAPDMAVLIAGRTLQRSEEHTSELQSQSNLVCRLLLEKKKQRNFHPEVRINHQYFSFSIHYFLRFVTLPSVDVLSIILFIHSAHALHICNTVVCSELDH